MRTATWKSLRNSFKLSLFYSDVHNLIIETIIRITKLFSSIVNVFVIECLKSGKKFRKTHFSQNLTESILQLVKSPLKLSFHPVFWLSRVAELQRDDEQVDYVVIDNSKIKHNCGGPDSSILR